MVRPPGHRAPKQGIDLRGRDADHGLPRSKGGADHPLNYRMIDASLNSG